MNKKLLTAVQTLFFERLEAKTSWGRNDLKDLYKDCVIEVLSKEID